MTPRERWTVYPLLLLAIGLAMRGNSDARSQADGLVTADTISCKEFVIVNDDDKILIHAGRVDGGGGGRIEIRDAEGRDVIALGTSLESRDAVIEVYDSEGNRLGRLGHPSPTDPAIAP